LQETARPNTVKRSILSLSGLVLLALPLRAQPAPAAGEGRLAPVPATDGQAAGLALLASPSDPEAAPLADGTRLLRFPATNGRQIVFSYADQLYTVGLEGGVARRLTNGPGYAVFPRFSPDGRELAFTAQYDGNTEVYLMPAEGGAPKPAHVHGDAREGRPWRPDGAEQPRDGMEEHHARDPVPLADALVQPVQRPAVRGRDRTGTCRSSCRCRGAGSSRFSPDDTKMAYNRVFREFRTWKDYRGGMADDIWIYDFKTGAIEDITNNPPRTSSRCGRRTTGSTSFRTAADGGEAAQPLQLRPGDKGDRAAHPFHGL
jgi:dipeptidyl aminopeptidase/acylaminoacyl peptidase